MIAYIVALCYMYVTMFNIDYVRASGIDNIIDVFDMITMNYKHIIRQ